MEAELEALSRRIQALELLCYGEPRNGLTPRQLMSLHLDAVRLLSTGRAPTEASTGWARAIQAIDEVGLLALAREIRDPAPWRSILRLLLRLRRESEDDEALPAAEAHLRRVIQNLLEIQGLSLLEPDDMLATSARPESGE